MNEFATKGDVFLAFLMVMGCFMALAFGHILETHRLHKRIDETEEPENE